jgi:hypothetical protein
MSLRGEPMNKQLREQVNKLMVLKWQARAARREKVDMKVCQLMKERMMKKENKSRRPLV